MKNNISYYRHETSSHNHWKFKTLRRKYGWAGEGRFWALNNIIADSDCCRLNITDGDKRISIATDLDLDLPEFNEFLNYLIQVCKLIIQEEDSLMTGITQECFSGVSTKREYQREWKKEKSKTVKSNIDNKHSNIDNEQSKREESKVKESKVKESGENGATLSFFSNKNLDETQWNQAFFTYLDQQIKKIAPRVAESCQEFTWEEAMDLKNQWPGAYSLPIIEHFLEVMQNDCSNLRGSISHKIKKLASIEKDDRWIEKIKSSNQTRNDRIQENRKLQEEQERNQKYKEEREKMSPEEREKADNDYKKWMGNIMPNTEREKHEKIFYSETSAPLRQM